MKYVVAAPFLMAVLVGAAPVDKKRDLVYSTTTVDEWFTVWSTTTVWEGEATAKAAATSVGGFFEVESSSTRPSAPASSAPASSANTTTSVYSTSRSYSILPAAVQKSTSTTSTTSSSDPASAAPTPTSSSTYIAPVLVPATSAAPITTSVYVAPIASSTAKAVVAVVADTSGTTTGASSGDMTYYDVSVGLTSCGETGSNSDFLVAMNKPDMANGANPNNNPHCNQYINIYYNGVGPIKGKVVDTCPVCDSGAIDVTNSLFTTVAPSGDGRVHGVSWSWA